MGGLGIKMDSILERKLFAGVMSGTLGLLGLQERNRPQGGLLGSEGGCVCMCKITCNHNITPYVHEQLHHTTACCLQICGRSAITCTTLFSTPEGPLGPGHPPCSLGSQPEIVLTPQRTMATGQPVWVMAHPLWTWPSAQVC